MKLVLGHRFSHATAHRVKQIRTDYQIRQSSQRGNLPICSRSVKWELILFGGTFVKRKRCRYAGIYFFDGFIANRQLRPIAPASEIRGNIGGLYLADGASADMPIFRKHCKNNNQPWLLYLLFFDRTKNTTPKRAATIQRPLIN
jgi:hypothetical protein